MNVSALYGLAFGKKPVNPANHFYGQAVQADGLATQFLFWLILHEIEGPILVDQGCTDDTLRDMGVKPCLSAQPTELLGRAGIKAEDIRHVIISHLHWDHFGGDDFFPNAVYWLHAKEMAHVTGKFMRFKIYSQHYSQKSIDKAVSLHNAGRLRLVNDEICEIARGVTAIRTGGHTPGLLSIAVDAEDGEKIICGDVAPRYANFESGIPCGIHYNVTEALLALETLQHRAGNIENLLPAHDPLILEKYGAHEGVCRIF